MSLEFIKSTPGMQIKRDMDFSNVMIQCDPRLLIPNNTTTQDSGLFKKDIAGKIGVAHDICDLDVSNLTVHGKLEICTITCNGNFDATSTGTMTLDTDGAKHIYIGTQASAKVINIGAPESNKVIITGLGSKITAGGSGIQLTSDDGGITLASANSRIVLLPATVPATAGSAGVKGEIRLNATFIYICTATNTWKRSPLSTWL